MVSDDHPGLKQAIREAPALHSLSGRLDPCADVSEQIASAIDESTPAILGDKVGVIRTETSNFWLSPSAGRRMIVYNPADDDAEVALRRLADSAVEPFSDWSDTARGA